MAKLQKCIFCGCTMVECITEEEAIEAFNNRVNEAKIRAKAIDEFAEILLSKLDVEGRDWYCARKINEIAEQLKEGE